MQSSAEPTLLPPSHAEKGADVYFLISPALSRSDMPALNARRKSAPDVPVSAIPKKIRVGASRRTKSINPSGDARLPSIMSRASTSMEEESPFSTLKVGALAHLYRHEAKSAFKLFPSIHIGQCFAVHLRRHRVPRSSDIHCRPKHY